MGMTNIEFFAIVVFVVAVLGLAAWREIKAKRDEAEARMERYEEAARRYADKLKEQEIEKLYAVDAYNEACNMEPFCGGSDAHTRSREAVARAQEAARSSMKPGQP